MGIIQVCWINIVGFTNQWTAYTGYTRQLRAGHTVEHTDHYTNVEFDVYTNLQKFIYKNP